MNKPLGLSLIAGLMTASLAAQAAMSIPRNGQDLAPKASQAEWEGLVHKVYTLQEQEMDTVNWVYLGYAPRIQDPSRVKVVLSKQGFTMRVNFEMTPEEVADYPSYLKRRAEAVESILLPPHGTSLSDRRANNGQFVNMKQIHKFLEFQDNVDAINSSNPRGFDDGYYFLSRFFPENVRKIRCSFDRSKTCVEGNFVYPITNHIDGMMTLNNGSRITRPMAGATPPARRYTTQFLDERRSILNEYDANNIRTGNIKSHIFNGFPAFWFYTAPGSKGVGVHGPIRYSAKNERNGIIQRDYLNDSTYWDGINPLYRFEIVRTADSEGCIRSQPMEMRHILPSDPKAVSHVSIEVINDIDTVEEFDRSGNSLGQRYVDVGYYVENHYRQPNKRDWYLKHFITYEERQQARNQGISVESVLDNKLAKTKVFPYLHPQSYEFEYIYNGIREDAPETMGLLNRAPAH